MIDKVSGNRIGSDSNKYLISLLKYCQEGNTKYLKDKFTEYEYNTIKNNKHCYPEYTVAHCGFNATFGAKWFGGFARKRKNGWDRDCICGKNLLLNQEKNLKDIKFYCCSYDKIEIPNNSIIYCDPPYENTTKYKDKFDHSKFWDWCREQKKLGHQIFISEYNAPDDFLCLWEKEIVSSLAKDTGSKKGIERLFTL